MKHDKIFSHIIVPHDCLKQCHDFAKHISLSKYQERNKKADPGKIKKDIMVGKVGEWVAYYLLKDVIKDISTPDMSIYKVRDKNWNPDLSSGKFNFSVKSQDWEGSTVSCGYSWTFQFSDSLGKYGKDKEIFCPSDPNLYIVFVEIDNRKRNKNVFGRINSIVHVSDLHKYSLIDEPVKNYLKDVKKVTYALKLRYKGLSGIVPASLIK